MGFNEDLKKAATEASDKRCEEFEIGSYSYPQGVKDGFIAGAEFERASGKSVIQEQSKQIVDGYIRENILLEKLKEFDTNNQSLSAKLEAQIAANRDLTKQLNECEAKIQKFITKSNGLSFYVRDEYEKSRLEMTDSVDLVEKIESLYALQCEVELTQQGSSK